MQVYFNIQHEGVTNIANISGESEQLQVRVRRTSTAKASENQWRFNIRSSRRADVHHLFSALFAYGIKP